MLKRAIRAAPDSRVSTRLRSASDRPMPARAPAVASKPAQNAAPISALITGAIGRKKPIAMQATQIRIRKAALATTLTAPRVAAAVRRLAYQRSAKATIVAAIRMNHLLNPQPAWRCIANGRVAPGLARTRRCFRAWLPRADRAAGGRCDDSDARSGGGRLRRELVLGLEVKIACVMGLMQLTCKIAVGLVHDAPSLHRRTRGDCIGPAQDVLVIVHAEKLGRAVLSAPHQSAVPGPDGHVRNRVVGARDIFAFREAAVEDIEQALRLHCEAIDGVFDLERRVGVEMAESAAEIWRRAHLPEEPRKALRALGGFGRQEDSKLLREIEQDCAGLEEPDRLRTAAVHQSRDLRVWIDGDEVAAELLTLVDPDQPGVVLGAFMAQRQQLLEHDRDLLAIGSRQRIELKGMAADRQFLVVGGAGDRPVDVRELPAARLAPGPDLWRGVFGRTAHSCGSRSQGCRQAQSRSAQQIVNWCFTRGLSSAAKNDCRPRVRSAF